MKILYIWKGDKKLLKDRQNCIEQTYSLYPNIEYYCVTNDSFFPNSKIINWEGEKQKLLDFYNLESFPKEWEKSIVFSDWYRFYYLINNPNTLFLDTDCQMTKYFDFEKETKIIHPRQEIFMLYAPSNNEFARLKEILNRHIELKNYGVLLPISLYIGQQPFAKELEPVYFKHK